MDTVANVKQQKHFILVHGANHGAWCWFKLKPLLESAGQRVTAIDLSAAGINPKSLDEVYTLEDYSLPLLELMASIPPTEKVVLVGHSYGGFSLALAMENYPEKVSIAIFVAAFMPDTVHPRTYQDLELAKLLVRPTLLLLDDSAKEKLFSAEKYGSVKRAYIVCKEDRALTSDFQHSLIENTEVTEAKEINDAGHMVMLSKPQGLCQNLLEIAEKYI